MAHFCVDSYSTLLVPVLPLISQRLGLNLVYSGLLGTTSSLFNTSQPLLGMWADRMSHRYLIITGLLLSSLFGPLIGIVPNYSLFILVLALAGLGVASFHPQAFSLAGELSRRRRSFGLALFSFGGTMGLGLAPFWVPYYAEQIGLERLPLVSFLGLALLLAMLRWIPLENSQIRPQGFLPLNKRVVLPLLLIVVVVVLRSITALGFSFYLTLLARDQGLSLVAGGLRLGIYNLSGVLGALLTGYLADHIDPKPLVWASILLSAPALYIFLHSSGTIALVSLALGGGLIMASNSVLVALAQVLAPRNLGLASSLPLGFSWGLASFTLPLIGYLGDQFGIATILGYLCFLPLCPAAFALLLPSLKLGEN